MTTQLTPTPTPTPARSGIAGSARRVRALSTAEIRLLWRNKSALFTALGMPVLFVLFVVVVGVDEAFGGELGAFVVTCVIGFVLLFVVYYNLVTAFVARREELVLKRLRTTEATDREILLGTAVPALVLTVAQVILAIALAAALLDLGWPVNPVLVVVAVLGGAVIFVMLAVASTAFTSSVEMAQLSTLPVFLVTMIFSGLFFPLDILPDLGERIARALPLTPVVELTRLGLLGTPGDGPAVDFAGTLGEALVPVLYLAVWIYLSSYAARRWFRWEPRT